MTTATEQTASERRIALVIGNAGYKAGPPLANPVTDAACVAAALKRLDFEPVEIHFDLDKPGHDRALKNFAAMSKKSDMAVVYYAGHGIELDGENYLLPVDAELAEVSSLAFEATRLSDLMKTVEGASRFRFVILDACRDNPFRRTMRGLEQTRSMLSRGLARPPDAHVNTLVAYAASAGTQAKDGNAGSNSPFAAALLKHIETPNTDIRIVVGRITDEVRAATENKQVPAIYGSVGGAEMQLKRVVIAPTPPPEAQDRDELVRALQEERDWEKAQRGHRVENYQAFLKVWDSGRFAGEAQRKIDEILEAGEFKAAKAEAGSGKLRSFVDRWPNGTLTESARELADERDAEQAWQTKVKWHAEIVSTHASFDAGILRTFLKAYPKSKYSAQVATKLESAEKENASALSTDPVPATCRRYLANWPQGSLRAEAQRLLDGAGDDIFWEKVKAAKTRALADRYLDTWPQGRHVAEAKKIIKGDTIFTVIASTIAGAIGLSVLAGILWIAYLLLSNLPDPSPIIADFKQLMVDIGILPKPAPEPNPNWDRQFGLHPNNNFGTGDLTAPSGSLSKDPASSGLFKPAPSTKFENPFDLQPSTAPKSSSLDKFLKAYTNRFDSKTSAPPTTSPGSTSTAPPSDPLAPTQPLDTHQE